MKRFLTIALAVGVMLSTVAVVAQEKGISITDIYVKDGLVIVDVHNATQSDTIIALKVMRQDNTIEVADRVYHMSERSVKADEKVSFKLEILDDRNSVRGSGTYIVSAQNSASQRDEDIFAYADSADVNGFVEKLKQEAKKVTAGDKAYEVLLPIIEDVENVAVLFSIGIDHDEFVGNDLNIRRETTNLLFEQSMAGLSVDNFSVEFNGNYGLATYNAGEKEKGLNILNADFGGEEVKDDIAKKAISNMQSSYNSYAELLNDFNIKYGIERVKEADISEIENVLVKFEEVTGECSDIIGKITSMTPVSKKNKAYENLITICNLKTIETVSQLEAAIEKAYKNAQNTSTGTQGGDVSGGVTNSTAVSTTVHSMAKGTETTDVKVEEASIFADISNEHWAAEAIECLKEQGIVSGTGEGNFEPDRQVTREEFAKMIVVACGYGTEGDITPFDDVRSGEWYSEYISAAVKYGVVNGVSENRFGIGENITRQDMAVMTARALRACGMNLVAAREYAEFADENAIAEYAISDVIGLYEAGVINGKGNGCFDPVGNATRAEAAKIIYEAFKGGI